MASPTRRPLTFLYPHLTRLPTCTRSIASSSAVYARAKDNRSAPSKTAHKPMRKVGPPTGQFKKTGQGDGEKKKRRSGDSGLASGPLNEQFFKPQYPTLDLPDLEPELLSRRNVGKSMKFPKRAVDLFRTLGVPANLEQPHNSFEQPCSVVRDTTLAVYDFLRTAEKVPAGVASPAAEEAKDGPQGSEDVETATRSAAEETTDGAERLEDGVDVRSATEIDQTFADGESRRVILHGPSGCGKSTILMQAVSLALSKDWIVLYTPRAITWVNSSTAFVYDSRTRLFSQPWLARDTLRNLLKINKDALSTILTTKDLLYGERGHTYSQGRSLERLVEIGLEDESNPVAVLEAVMWQLTHQQERPFLWAVDDFQAFYSMSLYRDPEFQPIFSYHLSMPRMLLDFACGARPLGRGVLLGALSTTHTYFASPVPLLEAIGAQKTREQLEDGDYAARVTAFQRLSKGLRGMAVPQQLQLPEALGLYRTYVDGQVLHTPPSDDFFFAKYAEASGNARQFRKAMMATMQ